MITGQTSSKMHQIMVDVELHKDERKEIDESRAYRPSGLSNHDYGEIRKGSTFGISTLNVIRKCI